MTEDGCGGGPETNEMEDTLVALLARKRIRLSAVIGMGSSGLGFIRDCYVLNFVATASGGVMTNVQEVRVLRDLFTKEQQKRGRPILCK